MKSYLKSTRNQIVQQITAKAISHVVEAIEEGVDDRMMTAKYALIAVLKKATAVK